MDLNASFFKYGIYYPIFISRGQNLPFYLYIYKRTQYLPPKELERMQVRKLNTILAAARKTVFQYGNTCYTKNIEEILDMGQLPFICKTDLRERREDFISQRRFLWKIIKTTGGSTGQPVTVWKSPGAVTSELAATWRSYQWAGVDIGDRQGRFWGVPFTKKDRMRSGLIDFVSNRRRVSAFSFNEHDLYKYHTVMQRFNPRYFYGYVSMIAEFADFLKRSGQQSDYDLNAIITTSEELTSYHRSLIETVFSTKVYNEYGCGEVGTIAFECEHGALHVMAENVLVEIYDGERRCENGEVGEIVVTELNNYAMPLIRYRLGDYAVLSPRMCACGRTLPVLENIYGREYDIIRNREGRLFHGEYFMYIFEDIQKNGLGVKAFQVRQRHLDEFHIKIVPEEGYGIITENLIRDKVRADFGKETKVEIEITDQIPRENSGKMRLIIGM